MTDWLRNSYRLELLESRSDPDRRTSSERWSGNRLAAQDRVRSIPLQELARRLPREFDYVGLQKELCETDRVELQGRPWIRNLGEELEDFTDTAAVCECLDLLISVDSSVAHLSAALGRPTWILLPFAPDYRWLLNRSDSPWYPTARLYRQSHASDWSGALARSMEDRRQKLK